VSSNSPDALPRGTYEEALGWVGRRRDLAVADGPIDGPMIRWYSSLLEDGNPSYWDEGWATERWGGMPTPFGLLLTWMMPLPWTPLGGDTTTVLATQVPLPGSTLINVGMSTVHHRPILVGERLGLREEVVKVSPEKRTRAGVGHFVVTAGTFLVGDEEVATHTNTLLRFEPEAGEASADPDAAGPPTATDPVFELDITFARVAGLALATRDLFPGHHDPAYARKQGEADIYLNTMSLLGLCDRAVLEAVGPDHFVSARSMQMLRPFVAGSRLVAFADVRAGDEGSEVAVELRADGRTLCRAAAEARPGSHQDEV
jgi:acyl dehydratase